LHLHRSTLYYRLDKITEVVGGDLRDGEARFELMLSLKPWMGDFVLPLMRLRWSAAGCGAVGRA
jgi:hypothetical protein